MLRNFLKIAFRNLWRNRIFSAINIAGLAMGMAACILILQYVSFEFSFDRFNKKAPDLYRVVNDRYQHGKLVQHGTITYSAVGKAMQDDYPEVADHARVMPMGERIIESNGEKFSEPGILYVDPSFLRMFSYSLLAGDRRTALKQSHSAIVTKGLAKKIFGYTGQDFQSLVGKSFVMLKDSVPFKVDGICEDVPENSHLAFSMLVSWPTLLEGYPEADYTFTYSDFWHYIQLREGTDYKAFNAKLDAFSTRHFQGAKISGSDEKFYLQPLLKAHLYSDFEYEIGSTSSASVVWGLLVIALFTIIIAWVNYINLATARSIDRAREVGVRKVIGASRAQLIRQFLIESLLINILALGLCILIVLTVQKGFNQLTGHQLSIAYLFQENVGSNLLLEALIVLFVAGTLLSGFYPAFILSGFRPVIVLKGRWRGSPRGIALRRVLVVSQFAITIALIIGSLVVYRQMKFMNEQDLGYKMDQVMIVKPPILSSFDSSFIEREDALAAELKQISHVKGVASSARVPGEELARSFNVHREGEDANFTMRRQGVNKDFIDLYGIRLIAGRGFVQSDYNPVYEKLHNVIIDETAAKLLSFSSPEKAVGQQIVSNGNKWDVVGVIAAFHQKSLRYALEPVIMMPVYGVTNPLSVKVATADLPATIAAIRHTYEKFFPGNLFDYFFLDERFREQYKNEQLFGKVFALFAGFAIIIACLGLFGLALFATTQRTKEIGVRKVLGASVSNVVLLLSKDFIRLVLLANIVAFPLAWWVMHSWLNDFAYRIQISWWIFVASALTAVFIALFTVSFQAIRAAVANPVKSLRTE